MDANDSSDDDRNSVGSKLKIVDDVVENDEHISENELDKEKETRNETDTSVVKKSRKKKTTSTKRKRVRSKTTNPNPRSRNKPVQTGLNGNYWNVVQIDRHANTKPFDQTLLDIDDEEENTTSSSEDEAHGKLQTLLTSTSTSSSSSSSGDIRTLLYSNRTFITCRSPSDSFFLCQVLQDVFNDTKRFRIRWCSRTDGKDDDADIDENTHFKIDYEDALDPQTVLTGIPNVIRHSDKTVSLKKQDIFETKRLLEKSIKGQTSSADEPMDLTTESNNKTTTTDNIQATASDNDSLAVKETSTKIKKRKLPSDKIRKQPPKKRARKISGEPTPKLQRQSTQDINEIYDDEKETPKPKRPAKKTDKPVTTPKAQLFKVQSNRLLKENSLITHYRMDPFFEDSLPVPFISSIVQGKLAIRAVLINDTNLLKSLIEDADRVCSVHVKRGVQNDLTAIHYAIKYENIDMLKILLEDLKSPKKDRCPFPTVTMATQSTGRANIYTFGFRTVQITAARGAKEGNNALNKDDMTALSVHNLNELVQYALKNNCPREIYDLLVEAKTNNHRIYDSIFHIVRAGHRKLAASIIGDIKDNNFYGFNNLHHQVLLYDNEDITVNRATSVVKKTKDNFQITPIHCAAINPNSKYLKQLLNIMPEYNILDKYERRPIHFAAACEGPEPLEYLLSKQVNFNDVDRGGNSPLHISAMNGRAINAEILLRTAQEKAESNDPDDQIVHRKFGLASINRPNKSRFYPLQLAVLNNHLECVKVLLQYGANVDVLTGTTSGKLTPLMLACQKGYLKIVMHLIENGAKIEARDRYKRTPLVHACMCGHAQIVSYLLRLGANGQVFDSSLNTALHYAVAYGWYFCVKLLIEAGANVNAVNSWQTTCLAAGFSKGHYGLCDYLLTEHHVDINFKTDSGLTLVMLTVGLDISSSSLQQLEYVVTKHKANCTFVDINGNNAFHYLAINTSNQTSIYTTEDTRNAFHKNTFQMAQILLDHKCNPNQMNNKAQSPLMLALQSGNYILVEFLINKAKVEINADISHDGKTLLHYFAMKCDEYDLIQTLLKLSIDDEMKKMGQMFDDSGRTPFHYCTTKFDEFCQTNKTSSSTDKLKTQYESILQMIEYCLESIQCDPDAEIQLPNGTKTSQSDQNTEDEIDENGEERSTDKISKPKQTSIFSLLRTVSSIATSHKHPLELFLKKTTNVNVLHHETHRTPLLHAIYLSEDKTANMLISQPSCDINLATSTQSDERQQTPLILACRLQLVSIIGELLAHKQCNILAQDYLSNQAIHYYLATSNRSKQYLEILNLFIDKLKPISNLNMQGEYGRTPLHIAVNHNPGTIDSTTDVEQILIDNGSDLLIKNKFGHIPLHNVFTSKKVGDDPIELCMLILKAMKYKSIDTENNLGYTPLHLAVVKSSTICVTRLQQHSASLLIENKYSNSIIGTCVAWGHINLLINFLQQSIDFDLGKLHDICVEDALIEDPSSLQNEISSKDKDDLWKWKYIDPRPSKDSEYQSLISLILEQDWQGALSLILNELERFHLTYMQILEAAIGNNKLNLVLRLLTRIKDKNILHNRNSYRQNLFHLLANMNTYDKNLLEQILLHLHEHHLDWNIPDKYGSYPLHYACVQHNFSFIDFLREKYSVEFNLNQKDVFNNTAIGLFFWKIASKTSFPEEQIRLLIKSNKDLDCLCNYDNEIAMNPLSFGYTEPIISTISYPPIKSDSSSTNVRTSPLINAIAYNNFPLTKFLLQLGADVNFSDEEKRTPLMHAVRQNNIDLVKLLLNKDYTIEQTNETTKTRKQKPSRNFYFGVATTTTSTIPTDEISDDTSKEDKFVVTSSIDLNASDSLGRTCIHHLVQPFPDGSYTSNIELLQLLHRSGASLTKLDLAGLSPLQYGAINGCQHLCDELTKLINDQTNSTQATIERFYINDPNKSLLDSPTPDYYSDAQQLIEKYSSKHPSHTENPAYQVDNLSGMSLTGEVVIDDEKNEPYDVRLTKTDVNYGMYGFYNFYRMQIIKHKSKTNLYFLFTRWGRIGDDGQHQLTPYSTLDECRKEFLKVFREKTGNIWKDTDNFESKSKKYTLIKLSDREMQKYSNIEIDFKRLQADQQHPLAKVQPDVFQKFLKTLINRQAIRSNINKTQLDIEWMPVSQLKRETLQKAKNLLTKLKDLLERKQQLTLEMQKGKTIEQQNEMKTIFESIYKSTNEYYTIIPLKGFVDQKLPVIDNEQNVKKQEKILSDLFELELAYKILLGAQANLKLQSPLDYLYKAMNCQFEAMNKDDIDSQLILRYIWATAKNVNVEQIFKIARPNEDESLFKLNLDNHYLLWHGTNICNLISILTRGLLIGPLDATTTGSLFGKGIYTADAFVKSLGYCSGVTEDDGERCFMILCEVALGKTKEVGGTANNDEDDDDCTKSLDLTKYQSRKAIGRQIPDPQYTITRNYGVRMPLGNLITNTDWKYTRFGHINYNEYIVYDETQVALRYLVQFRR